LLASPATSHATLQQAAAATLHLARHPHLPPPSLLP